jgi:hypothetical protein
MSHKHVLSKEEILAEIDKEDIVCFNCGPEQDKALQELRSENVINTLKDRNLYYIKGERWNEDYVWARVETQIEMKRDKQGIIWPVKV